VEVPTFREALETLAGRAGVNVEIKNMPGEPAFDSPREAIAEEVLAQLEETGFSDPVLISSFNWLSIERVRHAGPDIPTGFLTAAVIDPAAALTYARAAGHTHLLPQAPALVQAGPGFIAQAHGEGMRVGTWTVDDPGEMQRLFAMGVDALATNRPDVAVAVRRELLGT
jgi:glycerophosphoryl diester phosphodiesterase